jgi:AAA family ATP:ADP antiporter
MVLIKAIGYAVNNPTKEMMYIPTSKAAKFKTKGWIDIFGSRGAKAGGGAVNNFFKYNINDLMVFGTLFGLGLIIVWIFAAVYVGIKNTKLVREGKMVG